MANGIPTADDKRLAQKMYCDKKKIPYFAGDGICPSCHRNCYDEDGYSLEYCSNDLITGCPFCKRSWCD